MSKPTGESAAVEIRDCPASIEDLRMLVKYGEHHHKIAAFSHPNADDEMLMAGMADANVHIRRAIMGNPKATDKLLAVGMACKYQTSREAAIRNPNASKSLLNQGLTDDAYAVRKAAAERLGVTDPYGIDAIWEKILDAGQARLRETQTTIKVADKPLTQLQEARALLKSMMAKGKA